MSHARADPAELLRELVSSRRFVYHILSLERWSPVLERGQLLSRRELGPLCNDYALAQLVQARAEVRLTEDLTADAAVPFYLTPRQPMFCRLVREGTLAPHHLLAIGFDFTRLASTYQHWLYSSNPAYPDSQLLGGWDNRERLAWDVLERWWWNSDDDPKEEKLRLSFLRQAELLIRSPVELADADHLVAEAAAAFSPGLGVWQKRLVEVPGLFQWKTQP